MEKHNKGGDADKQPAGRISRLFRSGVLRVRERRQMGRHSVLSQICLSLCLPKYSVLTPPRLPAALSLLHPSIRSLCIHPSVIYSYPHAVEAESDECKTGRPGTPCECRRIFLCVRVCPSTLQYLRVGLVVLAVVGGGIGGVWSRGCSCRAVGEGAGALGDDGRDGGAVHPGASLPSLGFTPHRP